MNYESILYDFNNKNIKQYNPDSDTIFYVDKDSIVYDIDIYCNADTEKLKQYPYYKQILKYLDENNRYYTELINELSLYVNDNSYKCSDNTKYYYRRALDVMSPNRMYTMDGTTFDNIVIKIKTFVENPLTIGSKITNRYGGKGVIASILPDNKMPIDQFGKTLDICLNPLGVIGRMNLAQCYEMELNFIADNVLRTIEEKDWDVETAFNYILDFYETIGCINQVKFIKERYTTLEDKEEFINDAFKNGLYIHQPPFFGNVSMDQMINAYKKFNIEKYNFTVNGKPIQTPMIAGNVYYMRLKHDARTKLSVRSSAEVSLNTNVPAKSSSFKYHTSLYSSTPIRCGEMERNSLLLTKDPELVNRYLSQLSSNPEERKKLITTLLTVNPFEQPVVKQTNFVPVTAKVVKAQLGVLGLKVNKDKKEEK